MNEDAELLRSYVETGSEDSFRQLVRRHIALVYSTALRRVGRDTHLAEDVAQTVFIDLARKAPSLRGHATLAGWLYVSTRLAAAAAVRRERRRKIREDIAPSIMSTADSAPAPDAAALRPVLDDAIVELKQGDREAIVLRFFEQRSFAEIGATLRLNEDAARKRVERALEKLRTLLARRGIASTTAALSIAFGELAATGVPAGLATKIASSALSHTIAAATGAGLAAAIAPMTAIVGIGLGGWAVLHQHHVNDALAAELVRLDSEARTMETLRAENQQFAQRLHAADDLRRAAADLPALREKMRPTVAASAQAAPARASVTVQSGNTVTWGNEPVSLSEFIQRLGDLERTAPDGNAKIDIRNLGEFPALAYVIGEARKARLKHVVVESAAAIDPKVGRGMWFGRR